MSGLCEASCASPASVAPTLVQEALALRSRCAHLPGWRGARGVQVSVCTAEPVVHGVQPTHTEGAVPTGCIVGCRLGGCVAGCME
eukprot:6142539-Heterocapsa_arctica.AAC.1